jgi:hypothetical protein
MQNIIVDAGELINASIMVYSDNRILQIINYTISEKYSNRMKATAYYCAL